MIGTLVGLLVAAAILYPGPQGLVAVGNRRPRADDGGDAGGRNHSLALLAITPLALMMGQLSHPVAVGSLLADRFLETLLGALIGVVALLVPDHLPGRRSRCND